MRKSTVLVFVILASFLVPGQMPSAQQDSKDCKDHPLFTRMPDFYIRDCQEAEFASFEFEALKEGLWEKTKVEGRKFEFAYYLKSGATKPGQLDIIRNHTNAIKAIGGTVLGERKGVAFVMVNKDGKETWAKISAGQAGSIYQLTIVEKAAMAQEVTADANTMAKEINTTGRVAVYGIYFDFNKSDLKPESKPTLEEIAKLLSQDLKLKLYVVGHTDNVGEIGYNMTLSQARAEAVIKALAGEYKIDAGRLKSYGVGPLCPVASNKSEEGRAKNRRVELVEQ